MHARACEHDAGKATLCFAYIANVLGLRYEAHTTTESETEDGRVGGDVADVARVVAAVLRLLREADYGV